MTVNSAGPLGLRLHGRMPLTVLPLLDIVSRHADILKVVEDKPT